MIDYKLTLNSPLVTLRPTQVEDAEIFEAVTLNPDMWVYFTSDLSNKHELHQWVKEAVEATKRSKRLALTCIDAKTGEVVGATSLANYSEEHKRVEIGWTWVAPTYQGKGYNAHIKYLLLKYCFETCGLHRVELKTDVLNTPARKAMQKIGLHEEGILRSHTVMTHGRRRDTIYYSVLKEEWNDIKKKNGWS